MDAQQKLARILGITDGTLESFERSISGSTGKTGLLEKLAQENEKIMADTLQKINSGGGSASHIHGVLQKTIFYHEKQFLDFLRGVEGENEFEKAANLARVLVKADRGFFLKKDFIKEIFLKRRPENLLSYLGYQSVDELINGNDLMEAFSALRFVESDEWMHQTFAEVYSSFKPSDFEARDIEIKVLGDKWRDIAKKFVEKKHHNVSHLKEFGVIFLNPIKMDIPGKFLRDFALLLHYFHEIGFYSKLFKKYSDSPDFAEKFKSLLRGDIKELKDVNQENAWLIVQRYLVKENPQDPRLFQPRVNPESIHWTKGERDLAGISEKTGGTVDLGLWSNLDWVGGLFQGEVGEEVVSFDLEDNAMSLVSFMEGKKEVLTYHQREAMWTKIFVEYAGGEGKLEEMILGNFDKGFIIL
ncbi:MAG: hypothetical protein HYV66_01955 [Candidatus Sungbacteria bacterium]|uniref:Uncharacterized protein n=1 Tax=Candidatus Sungiibacteriota bacterium TaxID=2750080 RepID=A0A932DSK6_9BACT|nr:hypothetical protein [Candidatus Sungbacteria bacterium]